MNQYAYKCIGAERKAILRLHMKYFSPDTLFWTASTVADHVSNKIRQKENSINGFPQIRYWEEKKKKKEKTMHKILILANIASIKDFCKSCCLKCTKVRSLGNIYCFLLCDFCNTSFLPETITSSWGCSLCDQAIHYMLLKHYTASIEKVCGSFPAPDT